MTNDRLKTLAIGFLGALLFALAFRCWLVDHRVTQLCTALGAALPKFGCW